MLEYNKRVRKNSKTHNSKQASREPHGQSRVNSDINIAVFLYSFKGLHKYADVNSEVLVEVKGKVEILSDLKDGYHNAKYKGHVGYIHHSYIFKIDTN